MAVKNLWLRVKSKRRKRMAVGEGAVKVLGSWAEMPMLIDMERHDEQNQKAEAGFLLFLKREIGKGKPWECKENVFMRNGDAISVDILLVWWQEKNCKYVC